MTKKSVDNWVSRSVRQALRNGDEELKTKEGREEIKERIECAQGEAEMRALRIAGYMPLGLNQQVRKFHTLKEFIPSRYVVQDIMAFYEDLKVVKRQGCYRMASVEDRLTAYQEMINISEKYPGHLMLEDGIRRAQRIVKKMDAE